MTISRFLPPALLGCCYFVAAVAAVLLTRFDGGVAYLWLATSILTADLMMRPRRAWLWSIIPCVIASMIVTGCFGLGWVMALPFAAANVIEAVLAAWLFRKFADPRRPLGSLSWLMHFVASVGIAGPFVAGLLAAVAASSIGLPIGRTFMTFVLGHALGGVTFTPIALLLTRTNRKAMLDELRRRNIAETVALLMLAIVVSTYVFGQQSYPLLFIPILPIILIAFRVGRAGVAISIAMLAMVGGLSTASGQGPMQLINASFGQQMQFFQFYLAATVLTLLPVTADLENRARLHAKLRKSESGYRMIAEHCSDIIFNLKIDGTIRYASPSCRQIGYESAQLVGGNCSMLIAPEHLADATASHLRSLEMGGETNRFEYLAVTASGEQRWHETHARLIIDDNGRPEGILSIVRDIHAQKAVQRRLSDAALVDSLTGLNNRLAYREVVERRLKAGETGACVAMLDIDHFKQVNDRFGHSAGDIVLRGFADVARQIIRDGDMVARIGGEEFAFFFPNTALPQALAICDRLRNELSATIFRAGTSSINVTVSGGVAELGTDGIDQALKIADMALYRAKQAGRNQLALAA
ncbi:diguanylate cyclase [Sphingomonas sp.]|uniref:sensor domain-containing diguanylate cyclase n=1 Tax=Sphingomonas sp. TaxID=28214 RepID=UPI00286D32CA|nr:diguanylate cyclase [Sphingomonas sp.]